MLIRPVSLIRQTFLKLSKPYSAGRVTLGCSSLWSLYLLPKMNALPLLIIQFKDSTRGAVSRVCTPPVSNEVKIICYTSQLGYSNTIEII